MAKLRAFSGIQPSGDLHLGNYLGAIRNWVLEQNERDNIYCVVDLHAITVPQDPKVLHKRIRDLAKIYIACGLDPESVTIFVQSHVAEHAQLAWLFNCLTPYGWLNRMTQFKEKAGDRRDQSSAGLFVYPALMAADILLYQADGVPVGDDQKQHVELTRDIAEKFNREYAPVFKVPQPWIKEDGARIMALDEPQKKMSKSGGPNNLIYLLDSPDVITKRIKRAVTDTGTTVVFDQERAGLYNLLEIYLLLSPVGTTKAQIEEHFAGKGYGALKTELAELVVETLKPIQQKYNEISEDPNYIEEILKKGADRIRPIAEKTFSDAKAAMGLG
ncbi:MAG: tryptophan--tRNA ligase [Chloroflexi bacterium]|nr:tryptophan--tRNA ligase [Chloroflexota bacterium]OJV96628.1 MAG: tryptophan--tRNA ligase [Chloroflexi bacterium 54-19]